MSVDVSKSTGFVVEGPEAGTQIVTKSTGYIVEGLATGNQIVTKATAYIIMGPVRPKGYKRQHDIVFNAT